MRKFAEPIDRLLDLMGWSTVLGSDVIRDGMFLELVSSEGKVFAEIFRADVTHTLAVEHLEASVPGQIFAEFCEEAMSRLDPFEDGTTFAAAGLFKVQRSPFGAR